MKDCGVIQCSLGWSEEIFHVEVTALGEGYTLCGEEDLQRWVGHG